MRRDLDQHDRGRPAMPVPTGLIGPGGQEFSRRIFRNSPSSFGVRRHGLVTLLFGRASRLRNPVPTTPVPKYREIPDRR